MIVVFYDGKCGLCSREINYYITIAPAGVFEWVDITLNPEPFTALGFAVSDGLKALHVRDKSGKMHIGVDGFIVMWENLPRWTLLAKFAKLPIIRPSANIAYRAFANWRFKKLGYDICEIRKG